MCEALGLVGELALVDEEPGVRAARRDLVEDPVERQLAVREVAEREPEGRNAVVIRPGTAISAPRSCSKRERLARDEDRPVAGADPRAVRQQRVAVLHERIRVQRDRRHLEPALERPRVERLDVLQHLLELEAARVDAPGRERPEHERVVGIRAVAEPNQHRARLPPA